MPEELWMEVNNIVQMAVTKTIPKKKKCKKTKWLSEEALQIAEERREAKSKGVHPTKCRDPEKSRERQESLLQRTKQRNRGKFD